MVEGRKYRRGDDCPPAVAAYPPRRGAHSTAHRPLAEFALGAERGRGRRSNIGGTWRSIISGKHFHRAENLFEPEPAPTAEGRWVTVTPNMHRVHQSSHQRDTDSNYGTVFTIWDRVFGTYCRVPTFGADGMQIGLAEIRDERTQDLWWQLKSPAIRRPI